MRRLSKVAFGLCLLAMPAVSSCTIAAPVTTSNLVYVSDFDLEAAQVQQSGPDSVPKAVPLWERLGYGRPRIPRTPEQQARALVDLMSQSLLDDLRKAGIPAQRLPPGAPLPSSGWLVRGAFLAVDAGGRLRQAVGLGAGSTQIEVVAAVDQPRAGAPQPLYTIDTTTESGKFPGAVVTLNPDIALGRFVLTRRDLGRNVTEAADDIADQVKIRIAVRTSPTSETR
jgi:hypothetical protein